MSPKPFIFIFGDPRIPQTIQDNSIFLEKYCFRKSYFLESPKLGSFRQDGCREIPPIRLNTFLEILTMGPISINKHEMGFSNLCDQETLKRSDQETKSP